MNSKLRAGAAPLPFGKNLSDLHGAERDGISDVVAPAPGLILGVDPGSTHSGVVWVENSAAPRSGQSRPLVQLARSELDNDDVAAEILGGGPAVVVCEDVGHYGMPVGRDVFDMVKWIGEYRRCARMAGVRFVPLERRIVKLALCGNSRAKDPNILQALLDRYGGKVAAKGRKGSPGPLYSVSGHSWAALAVVVAWLDGQAAGS